MGIESGETAELVENAEALIDSAYSALATIPGSGQAEPAAPIVRQETSLMVGESVAIEGMIAACQVVI